MLFFPSLFLGQVITDVNQYMYYQPVVNYAAATSYSCFNGGLFYRNQWSGFNGSPQTGTAMASFPLPVINSVVGFQVYSDKIGARSTQKVTANYGYRFRTGKKSHLGLSISPSLSFLDYNYTSLVLTEMQDPLTVANFSIGAVPNFDFGSYYFRDKFYIGIALPQLLVNEVVGERLARNSFQFNELNWMLHSGVEFSLGSETDLSTSMLLKSDAGTSLHGDLNLMLHLKSKRFGIGASYRTTKDIVMLVKIQAIKELSIAYAYQKNFSFKAADLSSHEVLLTYNLCASKKVLELKSPRF